jgi:photosystem II stability/assembly factor-like uncharacterized protein
MMKRDLCHTLCSIFVFILFCNHFVSGQWNLQNPATTTNHLHDIAVITDKIIIAVGDSGTIVKTSDAGKRWKKIDSGVTDALRSVYFIDSTNGWAVGDCGAMIFSNNCGESWSKRLPQTDCNLHHVFFADSDSGWSCGFSYSAKKTAFLTTADGGEAWEIVEGTMGDILKMRATGWNEAYAANYHELFYSSDGGRNWENDFTVNDYLITGQICSFDRNNIFVSAYHEAQRKWCILKKGSPGAAWAVVNHTTFAGDIVAFRAADNKAGWVLVSGSVYGTTDGGETWDSITTIRLPNQDKLFGAGIRSIYPAGDKGWWAAGLHGVIAHSDDAGGTWNSSSVTNGNFSSVDFVDPLVGYAVGDRGIIVKTVNGGSSWYALDAETDRHLRSLYFVNRDTGWICGGTADWDSGVVFKTIDGGKSWDLSVITAYNDLLYSIHFVDAQNGWAVGGGEFGGGFVICRTRDGGQTWTQIDLPYYAKQKFGALESVFFIDTLVGWAAGYEGNFLSTNDGGATWKQTEDMGNTWCLSIYFIDTQRGWCCGHKGIILHTADGGVSWQKQQSNTELYLHSIYFADAQRGWAVGGGKYGSIDGSVIVSTHDGGATWNPSHYTSPEFFIDISMIDSKTGWIVGSNGTILKTINGGGNEVQSSISEQYSFSLRKANISLVARSSISNSMYDLLGRKVQYRSLHRDRCLPSGVYIKNTGHELISGRFYRQKVKPHLIK